MVTVADARLDTLAGELEVIAILDDRCPAEATVDHGARSAQGRRFDNDGATADKGSITAEVDTGCGTVKDFHYNSPFENYC